MFSQVIDAAVGCSDAALDDELAAAELLRREHDARLAGLIAVADARNLYLEDGHRSMNAYLRARFSWSRAEAASWLKRARVIDALPSVGEALDLGRIGMPQVTEFARAWSNPRVRDALTALAPTLVEHAETLEFPDFQIVLAEVVRLADEDGAEQDEIEAAKGRRATGVDANGELFLKATGGDAMATAELLAILERFTQREFDADCTEVCAEHGTTDGHDLPRTATQRRFDAIHAVFHTANGVLDGELAVGVKPEPLVRIVIDDATWARMLADSGLAAETNLDGQRIDPFTGLTQSDGADLLAELVAHPDELLSRRCETSNGLQLSPRHVLQAALAGHVYRTVVDAAGVTIDQGRKKRLFAGSARDAATALLRRCSHPGCDVAAGNCEVDHELGWDDHGTTDQANAGLECPRHNREKHRKKWRVRRDSTGRRYTVRADGTIMLPVGQRRPRFPDDRDPDATYLLTTEPFDPTLAWVDVTDQHPHLATDAAPIVFGLALGTG